MRHTTEIELANRTEHPSVGAVFNRTAHPPVGAVCNQGSHPLLGRDAESTHPVGAVCNRTELHPPVGGVFLVGCFSHRTPTR